MTLEKFDMQGLVGRGYDHLPAASFLLLYLEEKKSAQAYLSSLLKSKRIVSEEENSALSSEKNKIPQALHIAFTSEGLRTIGVNEAVLKTFSREFLEGMVTHHRSFLLGDVQSNSPQHWLWGNINEIPAAVLLCYSQNDSKLDIFVAEELERCNKHQVRVRVLHTFDPINSASGDYREHFGFRDGISKPLVKGFRKANENRGTPVLNTGEFILGYKNEYNVYPETPHLPSKDDLTGELPEMTSMTEYKNLGKNGTYLVFRQIHQRVFQFWQYLKKHSVESGETTEQKAVALGAKMIGRWPGGAPRTLSPVDDPSISDEDRFDYSADHQGMKCPFGAHIRRANPRDQIHSQRSREQAIQMVRKHHMLRRGRIYGNPLAPSLRPEELMNVKDDDSAERGLHFICLVSDIARQFEFVQNVWANNFTFADLCNEVDPVISPRPADKEPHCNEFTVQNELVNYVYRDMPQFTQVVGGAYFFLPGLRALKYFAHC